MGAGGFASSGSLCWDAGTLVAERRTQGVALLWGHVRGQGAGTHGLCRLRMGTGHGTPYLVDVGHHVGGGAPVHTELGRQGLPLLGEHTHMRGVHQHRQDTQALLLQRVEHHQEPAGGVTREWPPQPHSVPGAPCPTPPTGPTHPPTASHGPRCPPRCPPQPYKPREQGRQLLPGRGLQFDNRSLWEGVLAGACVILGRGAVRAGLCPLPLPAGPRDTDAGWDPFSGPPPSAKQTGRAVLPGGACWGVGSHGAGCCSPC